MDQCNKTLSQSHQFDSAKKLNTLFSATYRTFNFETAAECIFAKMSWAHIFHKPEFQINMCFILYIPVNTLQMFAIFFKFYKKLFFSLTILQQMIYSSLVEGYINTMKKLNHLIY